MRPLSILTLATALVTAAAVLVLWVIPVTKSGVDTLSEAIPQITSWWDSGEVYKLKDIIKEDFECDVPPWVPKVGTIAFIAAAAALVYKKKIKPPEKKGK